MLPLDATVIAVMGVNGVGKTTFIRYATDAREGTTTSNSLEPYIATVTMDQIPSTRIYLLDIYGFDGESQDDTKILSAIQDFMEDKNAKIQGVIYLHAITQPRMRGSPVRKLRMFRNLIGENHMKKCCLVTTKWSLQPLETSIAREEELLDGPQFWQPIMNLGASIARFGDSSESARSIINLLLSQDQLETKLAQGEERTKEIEQPETQSQVDELAAILNMKRARLEGRN